MLRLTVSILIVLCLLFTLESISRRVASVERLTRLTITPEHAINLNPTLSDNGRVVVFESSADFSGSGQSPSFSAVRAELGAETPVFKEIGRTRVVSPAVSGNGRIVVFASTEDLTGQNSDRNSEIFLFNGAEIRQLTQTTAASSESRISDGCFQPSITSDGRTIVFSSNRNIGGENEDLSFEIFLYDAVDQSFVQLTRGTSEHAAVSPKISGDGTRVYYKRTAGASDLVSIDIETNDQRVVAAGVAELSLTEGRAVSEDGMRVVYSSTVATNQSQVFVYEGRENAVRQVTALGSRAVDVKLQATISGDGRRIAFATRRRVLSSSDGGVELYLLDLPTGQVQQVTDAPAAATAEVVSSLNFDGSRVAFNFPRVLSGPVSQDEWRNNSEIYIASIAARPEFGVATVVNAASQNTQIAPGSIATIRGDALAFKTESATFEGEQLPFTLAGTTVKVNGQEARMFYASPEEVVFVVPGTIPNGPAEFVVTNSEGFSSKAEQSVSAVAPGIFTSRGDGRGDAIILDSDMLTPAPFDPGGGQRRLSIFTTGAVGAKDLSVTIKGRAVDVETVAAARLPGLDEIHVRLPEELGAAGSSTLVVTADGVRSNSVSVVIGGSAPTPTPTPTPTPNPTPSPTATPTPTPSPSPSPSPTPTPIPSPSPTPTPDASPAIVISQIYGGGGNAGAPFRNDFIEIFNHGTTAINLEGWSVQYASATASTWSITPLTSFVLLPGRYYLVQEGSGGSNGALLPAPNATGAIAMAAGAGKVALVRSVTALSGTCPNDPSIVDVVGYGSNASCFKGAGRAPAGSNTNAIVRAANGCTNTNNNGADFATGAPNPRNTASATAVCDVVFSRKGAKEDLRQPKG